MQGSDLIHESVLKRFERLINKNSLGHSYLLIGPQGIGKIQTAKTVAKAINCLSRGSIDSSTGKIREFSACNQCAMCKKIESGNHPDITMIGKDQESSIKISKIRQMITQMQLRPFEAKQKIFIINEIEKLTLEGSNALLKNLEEPAKNTLLLLTSSIPEKILPTVKSRCHVIHFFPLAAKQLAQRLIESYCVDNKEEALFLADFSEGCLGASIKFVQDQFYRQKNEMIDNMAFHRNNESYIKTLIQDKDRLNRTLNVLLSWYRDLFLLKRGISELYIIHKDRLNELYKVEDQYSFEQLLDIIKQIIQTLKMLQDNLNVKIPLMILKEKLCVN